VASLLVNFMDKLEKECALYEELAALADQQTPAIVKGDVGSLGSITEKETELVGKIQHLEKQRTEALADIANVVNRDVSDLKLNNLIQMLAKRPDEQHRLSEIHDRLKNVVGQLRQTNEKNRLLLGDALDMVNFNLTMLQGLKSAPQTANYTKEAYRSDSSLGVLHGGFDAKQ